MSSEAGCARGSERVEGPGYGVCGVEARNIAQPAELDQLVEVMRSTAADEQAVVVRGAGTQIDEGHAPDRVDVVVQSTRLDRIVEHAAGDLVVTVQAGVPLADLQAELAGSGQWLALDPPYPEATVGGIVAAAASGPRRLRWGTPRDLVIGMTVVLADGTVARSGGKVVKNVAGYDMGKLFTGSYGTLGVIAELTFRLHPRPKALRAVTAQPGDLGVAVDAVKGSGVQPSAIEWDGDELSVLVEGSEPAARAQAERIAGMIGGAVNDRLPDGFGDRPWERPASRRSGDAGQVGLKVTHRLGALGGALDAIHAHLPAARIRSHAGSGVIWVGYDDGDLGPVTRLRRAVAELDGQVTVVEAPAEAKQGFDVWGPVRGIDVMRRIKEQFDPERRMAPGRFIGGL